MILKEYYVLLENNKYLSISAVSKREACFCLKKEYPDWDFTKIPVLSKQQFTKAQISDKLSAEKLTIATEAEVKKAYQELIDKYEEALELLGE